MWYRSHDYNPLFSPSISGTLNLLLSSDSLTCMGSARVNLRKVWIQSSLTLTLLGTMLITKPSRREVLRAQQKKISSLPILTAAPLTLKSEVCQLKLSTRSQGLNHYNTFQLPSRSLRYKHPKSPKFANS